MVFRFKYLCLNIIMTLWANLACSIWIGTQATTVAFLPTLRMMVCSFIRLCTFLLQQLINFRIVTDWYSFIKNNDPSLSDCVDLVKSENNEGPSIESSNDVMRLDYSEGAFDEEKASTQDTPPSMKTPQFTIYNWLRLPHSKELWLRV